MSRSRRHFLRTASAFGVLSRWSVARQSLAQQASHQHQQVSPQTQQSAEHQMGPMSSPPANAVHDLPMLHSLELAPFVDELPLPERIVAGHAPVRVTMKEVHAKIHRDVPATRFWSYGDTVLAPVIEARSKQQVRVEWINKLPQKHFLPIDFTLHGCGHDVPEVRACVHLHGAKAPSKDDGQPDDWYVPGKSRVCTYPMHQEATGLWYHDHAMGINRLNMYAGLIGQFLIRDEVEDALDLPKGKYELPLTLYDRDFTNDGQLFYPSSPDPLKPWVSEFLADAILINGKVRPFHNVEPRVYRLRLLNAANSRFFRLSFVGATVPHQPVVPVGFHQIGSDQGLLQAAVPMDAFTFAPGERADVLIDFSRFAGQNVHLRNSAFDLLEFRVAASGGQPAKPLPAVLRTVPKPDVSTAIKTRTITLNEYKDNVGNSMVMLLNRKHWHEPVTETPKLNTTEIWEFVNLTEDVHPMHLHLVRFQILDRRVFDTFDYLMHKNLRYVSAATPPAANEAGWKDVVQCTPGEITRILVHFDGYAGRYLYHCHILEHEANDMMRPFEVLA